MTELNVSYAEPSYITRLALKRAPFSKDIDPHLYFNGGQLEQRLNLLLHLAHASNNVGVVIADSGFGKTTLINELQKRAGDSVKLCHIDVLVQQTAHQILEKCLLDLGLEQSEIKTSSSVEAAFQSRLLQLHKLHLSPLLLIDNAHLMNEDSLSALTQWLLWRDGDDYLLQAIIASTNDLPLTESLSQRVQTVDIPALTKKEVSNYLNDRMMKAGYVGQALFSDKQLKRFFNRSNGNPRALNQLAHQHLLGLSPSPFAGIHLPSFKLNTRWIGITILVLIISLLLLNQDQLNALFEADNNKEDNKIEIISEPDDLATIDVVPDQIRSNDDALRQELTDLIAAIPDGRDVSPELASSQNQSAVQSVLYDETWIRQQQGNTYTFQLMGSWDKQEALDFIEKYALKGQVAMFESIRNERVWYAIIYGVYSSKKSALEASNSWPAPLNTLPSWLRRFDSIQKQIKNTP